MEDDEEFSYSGYSKNTAEYIRANGKFTRQSGDESAFAAEIPHAAENGRTAEDERPHIGYGDYIVEDTSPESAAHKLSKATHISERTGKYIIAALYLAIGVICVVFTAGIREYFPYIIGAIAAGAGIARLASAIVHKEYVHTHSNKTAWSLVMIALGLLIMIEHAAAYTIIAVAWGFWGLMQGAHALNHAFSRLARSKRSAYYFVKGAVEVVLAFIMLYEPGNNAHITLHIIVFGIQLIFDAFTTFPPIKEYLSRR